MFDNTPAMGKFPWKLKQTLKRKLAEGAMAGSPGVIPKIEEQELRNGRGMVGTQSGINGELFDANDLNQKGSDSIEAHNRTSKSIRQVNNDMEETVSQAHPTSTTEGGPHDSSPSLRRSRRNATRSQEIVPTATSIGEAHSTLKNISVTSTPDTIEEGDEVTVPAPSFIINSTHSPSSSNSTPVSPSPSPSPSGTGSAKRVRIHPTSFHQCTICGKMYKHKNCLTKHAWEHHESWAMTKRWCQTKHQQVQMLEAAQVLTELMLLSGATVTTTSTSGGMINRSTVAMLSNGMGIITSNNVLANGTTTLNGGCAMTSTTLGTGPIPITPKTGDKLPLPTKVISSGAARTG